jgi:hypothetical protein
MSRLTGQHSEGLFTRTSLLLEVTDASIAAAYEFTTVFIQLERHTTISTDTPHSLRPYPAKSSTTAPKSRFLTFQVLFKERRTVKVVDDRSLRLLKHAI